MTRMVGSTFGVAALGAIIATVGRGQLATRLPHVSSGARAQLVEQLGSGASTTHLAPTVQTALNETYVYALSKGLYAIGALALLGALLAWTLVRDRGAAQLAPASAQPAEPAPALEPSARVQEPETIPA